MQFVVFKGSRGWSVRATRSCYLIYLELGMALQGLGF